MTTTEDVVPSGYPKEDVPGIRLVVFDWDGTLAMRDGSIDPDTVCHLRDFLDTLLANGTVLGIMSYNVQGVGNFESSKILKELRLFKLDRFFKRDKIWGYNKPVYDDAALLDINNVDPVFVSKGNACDITCKARAIWRICERLSIDPVEVLYVDNSCSQTRYAVKERMMHTYTVFNFDKNGAMTVEDMSSIFEFVAGNHLPELVAKRVGFVGQSQKIPFHFTGLLVPEWLYQSRKSTGSTGDGSDSDPSSTTTIASVTSEFGAAGLREDQGDSDNGLQSLLSGDTEESEGADGR